MALEILRMACWFVIGFAVREIVLRVQTTILQRKLEAAIQELDLQFQQAMRDAEREEARLRKLHADDVATGTPIGSALAREMGIELPQGGGNE